MSVRMPKTSYSELSVLAECEQKWAYRYLGEKQEWPSSPAQQKGRLIHAATAALWAGLTWLDAMKAEAVELGVLQVGGLYPDSGVWPDAVWLMERYARHYGPMSRNIEVISTELKLAAKVPGTNRRIGGYVDELWRVNGKLWLVERKTMKDWRRLDLLAVDPQLTTYYWLARENGLDIYGVVFDAIRTYRWALQKPTQKQLIEERIAGEQNAARSGLVADVVPFESRTKKEQTEWAREAVARHPGVEVHPDSESFDMLWLDRTDEQVEVALRDWAKPIIRRREQLNRRTPPIRNISTMSCGGCDFKEQCFESLAFPPVEFEVEFDA